MGAPRLLIADEPTRGVDVGAKAAIHELLISLAPKGTAIVLISSEFEEVLGSADRVLVMRAGRVVTELRDDEITRAGAAPRLVRDGRGARRVGGRPVTVANDAPQGATALRARARRRGGTDPAARVRDRDQRRRALRPARVREQRLPHADEPAEHPRPDGAGGDHRVRADARDHRRGLRPLGRRDVRVSPASPPTQLVPHIGVVAGARLRGARRLRARDSSNAFFITVLGINPFIATLASSFMFYGIAQVMTSGYLVTVERPELRHPRQRRLGRCRSTPSGCCSRCSRLRRRSSCAGRQLGRYIFAVGGNAEAARLSGVRVNLVRPRPSRSAGLAAGLAGVLAASRISQGQAERRQRATRSPTIAAVVIGGTSILGGEGAVWRSVLGVYLLAMIGNGFNLLNVNPIYQQIVQGGIIVLAVAMDTLARRTSR